MTIFPRNWPGSYALDVEDSICRIHGSLVFGGLANKALVIGERNEGGSSEATLLVGNCEK